MPRPSNYIPTLDGWRALAVIAVIGTHGRPESATWLWFFEYGGHGVAVFFGISGYLICSRLLDEEDAYGSISLKKFYLRRAFRILPPVFFYVLIINLLGVLGLMIPQSPGEALASLFFFRNYFPQEWSASYTGHFWSLAVEEHFYLFWPALLLVLGSRRALWITPLLALAISAWRYLDLHFHLINLPGLYYQHTGYVIDGLLWGCALALLMKSEIWKQRLKAVLSAPAWVLLLAAFLFLCVNPIPLRATIEPAIIPLLLIGTVLNPEWRVSRVLESKVLAWVGRLSYSLYIWQSALFVARVRAPSDLQVFPLNVIALLAVACFSYYMIEGPLNRFGQAWSRREKVAGR